MRLRRVVLSGFKTFADRTEVRFEPGITAVVGANGSGKSNLVDGVRWALGETSARELRGSRLDEVIFTGGQGRARMGVADVDLVLDNEDGRIPVDDAEVALSRRVVRGGEVEYRINGHRARLRDLERLLSATGLTQHGYAVVAQHDIEAIIEATPRQRRSLVEQAAGVRAVRSACDDALRRLEQVDAAVLRLAERLGESEPRLAELALESQAALEQRGLAERLAELRGSLAREEWRAARAQARQARRRLDAADRHLEAAREAELAFTDRVGAERRQVEEARAAQRSAADRLEEARVAAERALGEARRFADRARSGVLHRADARGQLRAALEEVAAAAPLRDPDREAGGGDLGLGEGEVAITQLRNAAAAARTEAAEASRVLGEAERSAAAAAEAAAAAAAASQERAAGRELAEQTAAGAAAELEAISARVPEARAAADRSRARLAEAQAAADSFEALVEARAAEVPAARAQLSAAEGRLTGARQRMAETLTRAASLRGQAAGALGGEGVISARAAELGAVRLAECLRVRDPADATAVEAALEPHLGAWLVADLEAAADLLRGAELREEVLAAGRSAGSDSGVPAAEADAGAPGGPPAGSVRPAISAVDVEPRAAGAVAHCLERTWLVAGLDAARLLVEGSGGRAVLPDGTVITRGGIRAGGQAVSLSLVAAAQEAEEEARAAAAEELDTQAEVRAAAEHRAEVEEAAGSAAERLAGCRRELSEAAAGWTAAQAAHGAESARVSSIEADLGRRREAAARAAAAADAAALEVTRCRTTREHAHLEMEAARRRHAGAREQCDALAGQLAALESRLAEVRRAADEAERRRAEAEERCRTAAQRRAAAEARVAAAETEVLIAVARGHAAAVVAQGAAQGVEEAGAQAARTAGPVAEAEARFRLLEAERGEVRVAVARAEDEVNAARSEAEVADLRVAELAETVRGEVDDDDTELDPAAAERAEREITRLERRIGAMGPVNALAPEQHVALNQRVTALRTDRDDLVVASREVRHLVHRLSAEAGRRFEAVFGAVGANFSELFTELFGGGKAALHLEDPVSETEEVSQTVDVAAPTPESEQLRGVEILAQPPGKRLQPLTHLSGGERALTALAMVLALQQVNPSPFYIFDEVDAPLDDTRASGGSPACSPGWPASNSSSWSPTTTSPWLRPTASTA